MLITVVSIEGPTQVPGKKYQVLEIAFKDESGSVKGKKLMSFTYPTVFNTMKSMKQGDRVDITNVKEGDYWQWTDAKKVEGSAVEPSSASNRTQAFAQGANDRYETKEERNKRQQMICKQSSLAQAVATLKTDKVVPPKENVLALAQEYYDWVVSESPVDPVQALVDMDDDIPY